MSDNTTIAPTQHNILPEQVVFVYNTNKSGSQEVAEYYQSKRNLPNENLIGLAIDVPESQTIATNCEPVMSEADYLYQIENPLLTALENLGTDFFSDGTKSIWVIILGFGIPLSYDYNGETIVIASRLHRLGHPVQHKYPNHTFDRRGNFKFFDDTDASEVFITAILDGPTVSSVKKLIDRSLDVDNQTFITGDIFIDPYGRKETIEDLTYQQNILDFITEESANLSLNIKSTVDIDDPYQEPTVNYFSHDSFYWGWFNQTFSKQLFLNQNERRVFLYNADDKSACNIHFLQNDSPFDENGSDLWCNIAINIEPGYASCAGSVSDPGSDAFLTPIPFFQALHQGASLGEAYLFASKYVSWKTVLIGDPLLVVNFPVDIPKTQDTTFTLLPNDEIILQEKLIIEESLAWGSRQSRLLNDVVDHVVDSHNFDEELNLLYSTNTWRRLSQESSQTDLYLSIVSEWARYIQKTTNLTVDQWLNLHNEKITSRLSDILTQTGSSSDLVFSSGFWQFEFRFVHSELTLENIHFTLEVSRFADFFSSVFNLSTLTDTTGWSYEGQPFFFVQLPNDGFPSNFSGRKVKFKSLVSQYLRPTEVFYVRWTAISSSGIPFSETDTKRIIITT